MGWTGDVNVDRLSVVDAERLAADSNEERSELEKSPRIAGYDADLPLDA